MTTSTPLPLSDGHTGTEEELMIAVRDALAKYDPVRMWGDGVQIAARGSTIVLSGVVRSQSANEKAKALAAQVKGVSAVENELVVDSDVEVAVAQALSADPRTQSVFPGVLVGVVFGVVYLKGQVTSVQVKNAASEVTSKVQGVRSVSNELTTLPELKVTGKQPTLKPEAAAKPAA